MPVLGAGAERIYLGVTLHNLAGRIDGNRLVARAAPAQRIGDCDAADHVQPVRGGQLGQEPHRRPVGRLGGPLDVHAEPRGEHLRQQQQRSRLQPRPAHQGLHPPIVGGLVFPGDVELAAGELHRRILAGTTTHLGRLNASQLPVAPAPAARRLRSPFPVAARRRRCG